MELTEAIFTIIGANLAMILTSIGITIALYLHADKKYDDNIRSLRQENRDLHGRLCAIEERKKSESKNK